MRTEEDIKLIQKRAKRRNIIYWGWIVALIIAGACITGALNDALEWDRAFPWIMVLWVLFTMVILGLGVALFDLSSSFSKDIKKYLVETASDGMFDSFSYNPDEGFSVDVLDKADMMRGVYSCSTDDMMRGEYNDVKFCRGDVSINTGSTVSSTFHGSWTLYSFMKPFISDLQVTTQEMVAHSRVNRTIFTRKEEKRHLFKTGDPEFDSIFVCSGQDEQEAMTLLTPTVRKRLIRLYQDTGLPMIVGWKDNELHFITGNALAPYGYRIHSKMDLEAMVADTRRKLYLTRRVIEELIMSRSVFSEYALEQYSMPVDAGHGEELRRQ
ncbi:MAG: DUF3137 domain-containing protein [Lachnospiraceae bacterium]|nr:DUF3137 domain-containing protein [Lachnospiraceae bacterium]